MMGKTTISWTNYSWNPWRGCHKVSQGCKNCYMFREQKRYGNDPNVVVRSKTTFNDPLKWKEPSMVFTCSWSDFFIEDADEWRDEAWDIIRQSPHTYQLLTKRVENIPDRLPHDWGDGYDNVWLGVSVESNKYSERIWRLIDVPAQVRFISAEPLLDWILLEGVLRSRGIHWVIAGGESGPNCRPMKLEWARQIYEDCQRNSVAFFMKQDSESKPGMRGRIPDDLWIQEFPQMESREIG